MDVLGSIPSTIASHVGFNSLSFSCMDVVLKALVLFEILDTVIDND